MFAGLASGPSLRLAISVDDLPSYVPHDKNIPKLPLLLRFRLQPAPLELFQPRHAVALLEVSLPPCQPGARGTPVSGPASARPM
ncbi:hypothetical protein DICSQDRAFT_171366 [Dichomitus squalens LYAD-421 SS1]|uniref:Uncharacterized protein n=2 Tax=Dichomitus squalens TaxID=114155 RepID=A0A4Q9MUR3_9APHY|nr:uncharacterized protein DICSQDRAFT_171366 [Dichomitus squalens LYAD-421 SS1]EJF60140.1 hypothetical protein DICSQDRAFT_171366 [Dichomitus squalens LYAD-421 SS1]TBU30958.1 hypothetical protein BD311DRAFT_776438 [Dichomitus squalens]